METIKVKIRTWDDMEKEYGLDYKEVIFIKEDEQYFVYEMEKDLPKNRIIKTKVRVKDSRFIWDNGNNVWTISPEMIEEKSKMKYPEYFI